jgi:proline racemase
MITAPSTGPHADAQNTLILGNGQIDRSPCGSGTSARMAVMHKKGELQVGEIFHHESSISSVMKGRILSETHVGDIPGVVPEISCRPFITGFCSFVIDPEDPYAEGFCF